MEQGGVYGFPVVDVRVTLYDGKYHSVDSSEMSFKMAGSLGFKEAMAKASPILLEPISELVVIAPEASQGDIMGDLNSKRGRIQGSAAMGNGEVEIVASVPTSEIMRYAIDLRSMTGGRGRFSMKHSHYDPVPQHLADKIKPQAEPARVSTIARCTPAFHFAVYASAGTRAVGEGAAAQFADAVGADALAQLAPVGAEIPEHELEILAASWGFVPSTAEISSTVGAPPLYELPVS